ncbi:helix-turn-helix domain-containing protein [Streptomyces marincola]|uniref:helix-turn-helix domain-containing protein n=1 Tax=Streptomyces marincola TaxID=2878388 RepID=UPI001CF142AF|nr:helix-turn-helix transcriptional regulator [Streptomyces marincola]UCM88542.1 helix-turn-helix transcriptional regulator [Streptomyces marincola]
MNDDDPSENLNAATAFGIEVKEVRVGRKLTQKGLGSAAGYSEGYVSKVESGHIFPSLKFVRGCDTAFGTNGLFERLRARLQDSDSPSWFEPYLKLERSARTILDYSSYCVCGLLQTEEYMRALFRAGSPHADPEVIEGKVRARARRSEILDRVNAPRLWVVLNECCLRTPVGGKAAKIRQLEHLLSYAARPNVDLQVMPFSAGAAAAHITSFTLLHFEQNPPVVWADSTTDGTLQRSSSVVTEISRVFDRLRANALPPDDSVEMIKMSLKE